MNVKGFEGEKREFTKGETLEGYEYGEKKRIHTVECP